MTMVNSGLKGLIKCLGIISEMKAGNLIMTDY